MGKAWVDKPWDTGPGSHSRVSTLSPSLTYEIVPIQGQKQPSHPPSLPTHLSPRSYLRSHPHHIGKQEGALTQGYPPPPRSLLVTINQLHPRGRAGKEPTRRATRTWRRRDLCATRRRDNGQGARTRECSGPSGPVLSGFPSLWKGRRWPPTRQLML